MFPNELSTIQTLIKKLTKEEFSQLCDDWDSGDFDEQMRDIGLATGENNFPEKYQQQFSHYYGIE